ncbi:MAG: macro domain-containing protein, partial [Myxococcota bacterium]
PARHRTRLGRDRACPRARMVAMKVVRGDLLALAQQGRFDVIVHGCNCQVAMGAGIAKSIRDRFPEAWEADRATAKGDPAKLGTVSVAEVARDGTTFTVVNAYTQDQWRGRGRKVEYGAVRAAMMEVRNRFSGRRIGYPRIGAGLAGGDWGVIARIVDDVLEGEDHTLVEFDG